MIRRRRLGALAGFCFALLSARSVAAPSDGLGDREVHEKLVTQASDRCEGYKGAYAGPLQGMDVSLARSVLDHHVLVCPDSGLGQTLAVVWYGNHRAITWNPGLAGSDSVLSQIIRRMARQDDFPNRIDAYDADGGLVKGQLVPAFTTRCVGTKECD